MAANYLLKIDGITGESKVDGHIGEIDVLSVSYGASNVGSIAFGGGGGVAKVNMNALTLRKRVDVASPDLFLKCFTGEHYSSATLVALRAGGNDNTQIPYLQYDMTDVFVSHIDQAGGGDNYAVENVSLSFKKVKKSYWPQNDDGSQGAVQEVTFNVAENKKE